MSKDGQSNIQRIGAILNSFDDVNTPQDSADIIRNLDLNRSTGFGLVRALTRSGWLERVDHGTLRLGQKAAELAFTPLEAPSVDAARRLSFKQSTRLSSHTQPELGLDPALTRLVDTSAYETKGPWRLGFANASTSNAWRRAMVSSIHYGQRVAKNKIDQIIMTNAKDDTDLQLAQIDELASQDIHLLLVSLVSVVDKRLSDKLAQLAASGLPIIAIDRRPEDRNSLVSFVTASDYRIGYVSALWLAEYLGGHGRVWMLSGVDGTSPALRRQHAALSTFSDFPGIRIEAVSHTDWTQDGGYQAVDRLLEATGSPPDGVWCDSGLQGLGSLSRLLELEGRPPAHTGGDLNGMYRLCLDNKVPMVALDYPASMGARAVQVAVDVLSGTPVPQRVEVPLTTIMPRGCETTSVKADIWAEMHVDWNRSDDAVLSQGAALSQSGFRR